MNNFFLSGLQYLNAVISFQLLLFCAAMAVPLENWRLPFAVISAERGEINSSPSNLFWDDYSGGNTFNPSLWPDTSIYSSGRLTFEPALRGEVSSEKFISRANTNLHFDLLSNIRLKNLTVRNALDVDRNYNYYSGYPWNKSRFATGRIEEAYLQYQRTNWFVRFGRMNRCWGPMPDRSLVLSNNPFTYDALEWQITAPFFEFRHMFAAFPRHGSELDTRAGQRSRFFGGHSLKFIFGTWGALGITETILFSRSGMPDLAYVNPFSIYTVINTNSEAYSWGEGGGNLMLGLDWWVNPFIKDIRLWGQIVFDDFQVDNEDPLDNEPNHWGADIGVSYKDFLPVRFKHHIALQYRYLSKWIYTINPANAVLGERYTYLDRSLGSGDIDGDEMELSANVIGNNLWSARLGLGFGRKDTNTIASTWPLDEYNTLGYRTEEPLARRTNVETSVFAKLSAIGYFKDYATLQVSVDNRLIRNKGNVITGKYEYSPVFNCVLTCHYSNLSLSFPKRQNK